MAGAPTDFESFRPVRERISPLPAVERVVLGLVAATLVLEPWMLGSMHPPSQLIALGMSALALAAACWPRTDLLREDSSLRRLLRFPGFWAGILLLGYIAVQGANPAWRFVSDYASWHLEPLGHNAELPSGVDAPFGRSNPWRALVIAAAPWLTLCALWCGFRRRSSFGYLYTIVVASAATLAAVGLAQRLSSTDRIFWSYRPANDAQFMASFIYRNHAGAYFDLAFAAALGLCAWHSRRWRRQLEDAGPTVVFAFASAVIGIGVVFSASRMAIALTAVPLLAVSLGIVFSRRSNHRRRGSRRLWVAALPLACVAAVGLVAFSSADVRKRFDTLIHRPSEALDARRLAREAAESMLSDRWLLGWGAGCFRYGFPLYAQHYPGIYFAADHRIKYWEHAHDDLIEFPLELGMAGMLPILLGLAYLVFRFLRSGAARNSFALCAAAGCGATVAHGWVDFVFQNPAVLALWCALGIGAVRWPELESNVFRRRVPGGGQNEPGGLATGAAPPAPGQINPV